MRAPRLHLRLQDRQIPIANRNCCWSTIVSNGFEPVEGIAGAGEGSAIWTCTYRLLRQKKNGAKRVSYSKYWICANWACTYPLLRLRAPTNHANFRNKKTLCAIWLSADWWVAIWLSNSREPLAGQYKLFLFSLQFHFFPTTGRFFPNPSGVWITVFPVSMFMV